MNGWHYVRALDTKVLGELPSDGEWVEWLDSDGVVDYSRFRLDDAYQFVSKYKIVAWRRVPFVQFIN